MYTRCPECQTIFEIDEEALQASLGIVDCGKCATRFDALRSLSDTLPVGPETTLGEGGDAPRVLTLTTEVTASGQEPVARRRRKRDKAPPAAADTAASGQVGAVADPAADGEPPAATVVDLSAELIADTIDGPSAVARSGDASATPPTAPVQTRFAELDIIPLAADELAAIESERHAPSARQGVEPAGGKDGAKNSAAASEDEASTREASTGADAAPQPASEMPGEPEHQLASVEDTATAAAAAVSGATAVDGPGIVSPAPGAQIDPAHLYIRPRARWYAHAGLWWTFACFVLALLLGLQLAWSERATLFRNPQTRPWVAQICDSVPCHLPLIADVSQLELLSRDIRPDPGTPGALVITATLRNDAAFRQPWPVVSVELSDIDGNPVAMRRFRPGEYMPDPARRDAGIGPGATVAVAFEVADPGKRAVNFQFGFD